jgi:hypothetical protein
VDSDKADIVGLEVPDEEQTEEAETVCQDVDRMFETVVLQMAVDEQIVVVEAVDKEC